MALAEPGAIFLHCLPGEARRGGRRRRHRRAAVGRLAAVGQPPADRGGAAARAERGVERMTGPRIVVALGGNALLRRGQPAEAETQRRNVARGRLRPRRALRRARARRHARQRPAGRAARARGGRLQSRRAVSARRPRRREPGHDRLPARPGAPQRARGRRGRGGAHAGGRARPTIRPSAGRRSRSAPSTPSARRSGSPPSTAGRSAPTGRYFRRVVASPEPQAIVELGSIEPPRSPRARSSSAPAVAASRSSARAAARRRRGGDRQRPDRRAARRGARGGAARAADRRAFVERDWGTAEAEPIERRRRPSCGG